MIETLLIAVGLSMDAFAVSVSSAACSRDLRRPHMVRAAFAFGLFQFAMPIAGWFAGIAFASLVSAFDHWIAFAILSVIGAKMSAEAALEVFRGDPPCPAGPEATKRDLSSKRVTVALALATSLDALAVGISFSAMGRPALPAAAVIGFVTLGICLVGFAAGKRLACVYGRAAEIAGGALLIGIGCKILLEGLTQAK